MNTNIYSDGIANVTLVDGILRYDLVTLSPAEENKMRVVPVAAVAMSLPGLLRTYDQLSNVIKKLVDQGVLKKTEPPAPDTVDASVPETIQKH